MNSLVDVRDKQSVHQKTGTVSDQYGGFAGFFGQRYYGRHGFVGTFIAPYHLDQRHAVDRIEKMHPYKALGMVHLRSQFRDRERGCVAGNDSLFGKVRFQFDVKRLLRFHLFDNGLDRDIALFKAAHLDVGRYFADLDVDLALRKPFSAFERPIVFMHDAESIGYLFASSHFQAYGNIRFAEEP